MGAIFNGDVETLSLEELKKINGSKEVVEAIKLIDKTAEISVDQTVFLNSHKKYLNDIIDILKKAQDNSDLEFDKTMVNKIVRQLEDNIREISV